MGKELRSGFFEKSSDQSKLNISTQTPGIYFIQIINKQGTIFRIKVIKQ